MTGGPAGRDRTTVTPGRAGPDDPGSGSAAGDSPGRPAADAPAAAAPAAAAPAKPPAKGRPGAARASSRRGPSRYRTAFLLLAAAGILAAGGWLLYGSRLLAVRVVSVTGTSLVPKSEVLAAAGIPAGLPLIRVDTAAVAGRIERITQVQSARVSRQWPDGVLIAVQERRPALAVPLVGGGFALVDASGVVVRQVKNQPAAMPRFIPAGPLRGNPGVRAAASVLRQLAPGIARRVRWVAVPTLDAVTLHLSGRVTVDWGSAGQSAQKARALAILMHTRASFYDVSAPGTAVTG